MVSRLKTPISNGFYHFWWVSFLTASEFSCLAMLATPYPVWGPTPMPQIPDQLPCIQKSAHEVLGTTLGA